jgi:4-amino-4-deoxy-L-arabinose transferase-like glycosyltransferase
MNVLDEAQSRTPVRTLTAEAAGPVMAVALMWIAVVGGITLRFAQLGTASLWFDEGYTAWAVSHPVPEIIRIIRADTAPPLYYILLRGWTHLFGFSELGLRSMSALMASIGLVVFVGIARRLLKSPWAVLAAVGLFSLSFMQIAYAHEARFYAMMAMLEAIDLYLVLLVCERSSAVRLAGLTLAWSCSLYTNNLMGVYLACLGIAWLLLPGRVPIRLRLRDAVIVTVLCAAVFAPWLPALFAQARRIALGFWPDKPDALLFERTISVMAGVHERGMPILHWKWHTLLAVNCLEVDLALLGLTLLASTSLERLRRVLAILVAGVLPIVLIFFYSQLRTSVFMERGFIASGVMMPLLVVFAADAARARPAKIVASMGVVCFIGLTLASLPGHRLGEHPEAWREACAFAVASPAKHRLVICVASDGEPLYRYYACNRDYGPRDDVTAAPGSFFALDPPQTLQRVRTDHDLDGLRKLLKKGNFDELVLIRSHSWWGDRHDLTLQLLESELTEVQMKEFNSIMVFRFVPDSVK